MHRVLPAFALCALCFGCSYKPPPPPKTVKISGKILLPDGRPLQAGRVAFKPAQPGRQEAYSEIESDGSFTLTSYNKDDGAVPGDYVVTIELISYKSGALQHVRAPVPAKYLDAKTSDLRAEVKEDLAEPLVLRMR